VPDNVSPQAIKVANEFLRPASDTIAQTYWRFKRMLALDDAQGWLAMFPADSGEVVDGSRTDGRRPVTNDDVRTVLSIMRAFVGFMETNTNQRLTQILKLSVNGDR
jgi:hypothetical protein